MMTEYEKNLGISEAYFDLYREMERAYSRGSVARERARADLNSLRDSLRAQRKVREMRERIAREEMDKTTTGIFYVGCLATILTVIAFGIGIIVY